MYDRFAGFAGSLILAVEGALSSKRNAVGTSLPPLPSPLCALSAPRVAVAPRLDRREAAARLKRERGAPCLQIASAKRRFAAFPVIVVPVQLGDNQRTRCSPFPCSRRRNHESSSVIKEQGGFPEKSVGRGRLAARGRGAAQPSGRQVRWRTELTLRWANTKVARARLKGARLIPSGAGQPAER
jgi:hypothetical protein